jgi:hypothetical protein
MSRSRCSVLEFEDPDRDELEPHVGETWGDCLRRAAERYGADPEEVLRLYEVLRFYGMKNSQAARDAAWVFGLVD